MTTKKKIDLLKTSNIFKKYPIILFFQHNNLTVRDWSHLRTNITQINDTKLFITKNSIIEKVLLEYKNNFLVQESNINNLEPNLFNIFQGPNFILACHTLDQVESVWKVTKSSSKVLFVGGLFHNQLITHLDLEKLLQLKNYGISREMLLQQLFYNILNINSSLIPILKTNTIIDHLTISKTMLVSSIAAVEQKKK